MKETKGNFFTFLHFSPSLSLLYDVLRLPVEPNGKETEWLIDGLFSFDWLM